MSVKYRDARRISNKPSFFYAKNSVARRIIVFNMRVVNLSNYNLICVLKNIIVFVLTFSFLIRI